MKKREIDGESEREKEQKLKKRKQERIGKEIELLKSQ